MDVIEIRTDDDELYLRVKRKNGVSKVITEISLALKFKEFYLLEERICLAKWSEVYGSIKEGEKSFQVFVSEQYIHLIIKDVKVNDLKERILRIIESA